MPGEKQYGTFTAINLNTGKRAWQVKTDQPMIGGALATAGNLVFTGEGNGHFNAYDARTGKTLWSFTAGAGAMRHLCRIRWNGKQYIAVACGGNYQLGYPLGAAVMVFALPGSAGTTQESEMVATRRTEAALSGVACAEEMVGSHRRVMMLGTLGLGIVLGSGPVSARPVQTPAQTPAQLAGRDWHRFGPKEKERRLIWPDSSRVPRRLVVVPARRARTRRRARR